MRKKLLVLFFTICITVSLIGCGNSKRNTAADNKNNIAEDKQPNQTKMDSSSKPSDNKPKETEPTSGESLENTEEEKTDAGELVDGMRAEFKEAMDSYEEFFDEYCAFMKKYKESGSAVSMLTDYTDYIKKYADAMDKLDKINDEELNSAELKYYTEVMGRINQKLLEVST